MNLFLVEDDLEFGRALQAALQDQGHKVVWVRLATAALQSIPAERCDAVLLDLGLPDTNGFDVLRALRAQGHTFPILVISARNGLEDRLGGFDLGADDYLIKPFDIAELLARLRAVVRRAQGWNDGVNAVWTINDLCLDNRRMAVSLGGAEVALSKTEFSLLHALMEGSDRVLTRGELEDRVLPHSEGQTLDIHISNLRKKIGEHQIRTVRGVGYMIRAHCTA
jgi:two-component system response regulator QseB/two-component system response regulator BasR